MTSQNGSDMHRSGNNGSASQSRGFCGNGFGRRGNWGGTNIAVMVLGFIFFWPVGLVILYWICTGRHVQELPGAARGLWSRMRGNGNFSRSSDSGNSVFNAYQQTQYDRIHEIKEEIKSRSERFNDYRDEARRRADEEEFNRFMSSAPGSAEV